MYRLISVVPLLLGVFSLVYSYRLSLGGTVSLGGMATGPGPGLWPFLVSCVIVLSSIALVITERDGGDYERFTAGARFVGLGLLILGVFTLMFGYIGFIIPGLLAFTFWLRFLSKESWRSALVISVLCTAGFYVLFVPLLGVPFPNDLLLSLVGS